MLLAKAGGRQLELFETPRQGATLAVRYLAQCLSPDERLALLRQQLDRWLDEPPVVEREGSGHTVWVFGAIGYRVNRRLPGVYPLYRDEQGRVRVGGFTTELLRPLATPNFLPILMRHLGLDSASHRSEPGTGSRDGPASDNRLAFQAYRVLLRDPRFRDLRVRRLPEALELDPELCRITRAARRTLTSRIASDEYSMVWRHERELRAMSRESPGLLALGVAALDEGRILPYGDAAKELHLLFRYAKLAPATWRYLVRHGSRILRPVWERVNRGHRTQGALEFLRELERAGHPAPPNEWVSRSWLGFKCGARGKLDPGWNPVPPDVVRVALLEASRVHNSAEEWVYREDLRLVFHWAAGESPRLDKLQRRAGWPWLVRNAVEGERRRLLLEVQGPRTWPSALGEVVKAELRATPVDSAEALVDEGMAFHNCIASYILECQRSRTRIFAVRDLASDRRVAVIRLDFERGAKAWVLHDVLGIANTPVSENVRAFASELALAYNDSMGGAPHDYEGRADEFDEALCALEADDA